MKPFVALILTVLAALAAPALAGAKELAQAEICGDEGCRTITDAADLRDLVSGGDGISERAVPPSPFYRVTLTVKHEGSDSWSIFYVPSGNRLALPEGQWEQVTGRTAAAYEKATAGLKPNSTPKLERVQVNGRVVEDPASYIALFTAGTTDGAVPSGLADWIPVDMLFRGETPWSGDPYVFFSPSDGLLQRGIEIVRIPTEMAASIRAGESVAAPDGFPWALAAVIGTATALAVAGLLWLALRRGTAPRARRAPIPT